MAKYKYYMTLEEYQFATPSYALSISLREKILRAPLGLVFNEEDLMKEWQDIHLGAFNKGGKICGCLVLSPLNDKTIKMRQVAVDDELQGKGIGTLLVKFAEKVALQKGFQEIVLNARIPAVIFYERMDYTKEGQEFVEVGISHYKMKKSLQG